MKLLEIAESYWAAEARRDLDGVLQHYLRDATFMAPGWRADGHDEIRAYYLDSAMRFPGLEINIVSAVEEGPTFLAAEWNATLFDEVGGRHPLIGANFFEFENGLFKRVRSYFDRL